MNWLRETRDVFHSYDNLDLVPLHQTQFTGQRIRSMLWIALGLVLGGVVLVWSAFLPASTPVADLHTNISYDASASSRSHILDIYTSRVSWSLFKTSRPVILFVRGSTRSHQDKQQVYFQASRYVKQGYVFVPITYRKRAAHLLTEEGVAGLVALGEEEEKTLIKKKDAK